MSRTLRVMAVASAAAITGAPLLLAAPALAHASPVSRYPTEGAVLAASPSSVRVTFNEPVSGGTDALQVVTRSGAVKSGSARVTGSTVSAPVSRLTPGRYALVWKVASDDGHPVHQASGFSVGRADPPASPTTVRLSGEAVTLSGDRVGTRSFALGGTLVRAIGQVEWRYPGLAAPFVWSLSSGKARGMLPFAGTYSVTIRAYTSATSSRVLVGSIRIRG